MLVTRVSGRLTLLAAALAVGCAVSPLGDDWEGLDAGGRDARAVTALRDLFAVRVDAAGEPSPDEGREVLSADLTGITYAGRHGVSTLRWADLEAIEQDEHPEVPARPVDLRLYVRRGTPSAEAVRDQVEPRLPLAGLLRPHVHLGWRARGARARMVAALEHAHARAHAAPVASATAARTVSAARPGAPTPTTTRADDGRLDAAEATLRRLRAWRDDGLITDEEYEQKRRALLEGL